MTMRRALARAALSLSLHACTEAEPDDPRGEPEDKPRQDAGAPDYDDDDDAGGAAPEVFAKEPSRGAAIALSADDSLSVVVNRDSGSLSVLRVLGAAGQPPSAELIAEVALGKGSEPWQVVLSPDGNTAFAILRRDQKLVRVSFLKTEPELTGSVAVGSEPTSIALSPSGKRAYVANWSDGTVSEVDTASLTVVGSFDLNPALVESGFLGELKARPALAHPRSLVLSNDGDTDDADEALYVTEYFAQQIEPEAGNGSNADGRKVGLVYKVSLHDRKVLAIDLAPLEDLGFKDDRGGKAGCYPNQLQSIALNGPYAYVVSVCASPEGPLGVKATTTSCAAVEDCAGLNLVEPVCVLPFAGAASATCADVASVKTTTAPLVSVIDTRTDHEVTGSAQNLNARFAELFAKSKTPAGAQRFPLFANDLTFVSGTAVAYVTANGIDAVFRLQFDPATGALSEVGASTQPFIDLAPAGSAPDKAGKNPIGIAIGTLNKKIALVANEVTRNVNLLDFNTQTVASGAPGAGAVLTSALPAAGSDEERVLKGKRLFNTGGGRWSLRGQGWGSCQSCHSDGLTDNVTWYFARGPRQSTSLDGSFASKHPEDQRIFNWTGIFDEVADFENNTRGISGGVGAIVSALSSPPATGDRIDVTGLGLNNLDGSTAKAADPSNPLGLDPAPLLDDWSNIERYMQTIRSPRRPSNLDPAKVLAGAALFREGGSCQGCHGGEKWTVSTRFYDPGKETNAALLTTPMVIPQGFPGALLPAQDPANQRLRLTGPNKAAFDQIACVLRPVGTFNVAEADVGIAELRADMTTVAQGDGNPAGEGRGYNPPSLLGLGTGAPYLHGGNARSLEGLFGPDFATHARALAPNFLAETDPYVRAQNVDSLIHYLLSIDEDTAIVNVPQPGPAGGSLCPETY